jgi:hypothetical protein
MPAIQSIDKKKFLNSNIYRGGSLIHSKILPYNPKNNHYIYLGGFIDFSTLLNAGKTVGDIISANKDLIKQGISTVGQVANSINAVSNTIKSSKDLEAIKLANEVRKKKEKENIKKENIMPEELEKKMLAIGQGFSTFSSIK